MNHTTMWWYSPCGPEVVDPSMNNETIKVPVTCLKYLACWLNKRFDTLPSPENLFPTYMWFVILTLVCFPFVLHRGPGSVLQRMDFQYAKIGSALSRALCSEEWSLEESHWMARWSLSQACILIPNFLFHPSSFCPWKKSMFQWSMSVLRLIPCRWVQSIDCAIHRSDQGVDTQLHCHDVSDRRLRAGP